VGGPVGRWVGPFFPGMRKTRGVCRPWSWVFPIELISRKSGTIMGCFKFFQFLVWFDFFDFLMVWFV
jgi:hypothetical protein